MNRRDFLKLAGVSLLSLAALTMGCGSFNAAKADAPAPKVKQSTSEGASQNMNNGKKILVAYFSWSGNTKAVAEEIHKQVVIGNVTFEPGCRNNWHIHHADKGGGQILLVTGGRGYYQEWGKPARELHASDVVKIPAGVKHWHGAAPTSWFAHLAIEVPGENTKSEWCEPVDAEEYNKLK